MELKEPKNRVGFIRIADSIWAQHSDAIKVNLADGQIIDIKQSLEKGQYMKSVDIILEHPEFTEVDPGLLLPRYGCDFFPNPDGTVTRGPMINEGLV